MNFYKTMFKVSNKLVVVAFFFLFSQQVIAKGDVKKTTYGIKLVGGYPPIFDRGGDELTRFSSDNTPKLLLQGGRKLRAPQTERPEVPTKLPTQEGARSNTLQDQDSTQN